MGGNQNYSTKVRITDLTVPWFFYCFYLIAGTQCRENHLETPISVFEMQGDHFLTGDLTLLQTPSLGAHKAPSRCITGIVIGCHQVLSVNKERKRW